MNRCAVAALFQKTRCLHGIIAAALAGTHGQIFTACEAPHAAILTVGDFLLCGGEPEPAGDALLQQARAQAGDAAILYASGAWEDIICRDTSWVPRERMAFHPLAPGERTLSSALLSLPKGFTATAMTVEDASICLREAWSRDFVSVFSSPMAFANQGIGMLLRTPAGEAVAGASSYVAWPGGIEVQLETRHDQQGHGYGTLIAAQLLQTAWAKGLTVSWDAANDASAHIAEKLGFSSMGRYRVWMKIS